MSTPQHTNRLIKEKSPYLLQHAHNPVDWYPWGQEAFDLAKSQDKPIFLSIGYATCHWCHVMEEESFTNSQIANLMNKTFVNIKVDREEHPEVDGVYMEFAQALMSSAGGWPLNVMLTPDLKPFFAITYLPPVNRQGLVSIGQFVQQIKQVWDSEERGALIDQADKIVEIFERTSHVAGDELPSEGHILSAIELLLEIADPVHGGMKGEPKFPFSYQTLFVMEFARAKKDSRALFFVELTLEKMHNGGIYDQLGGGFSRYSVDERWMIPHFEKMLYDNALLARTYLEAWKYTKKGAFKEVCMEILDYVLRDMSASEGGFYSAEDADSCGHEGLYYTWTQKEIYEVIGRELGEIFCLYYGVREEGNFEGRNVLYVEESLEEFSQTHGMELEKLRGILASAKMELLKCRAGRERPFKDDKILSSWNGLMIDAMIKASTAFGQERYEESALKAAHFIRERMWQQGHLMRRYREGEARFSAGIDEYAFLIKGALSLFEEGHGSSWLRWAMEMERVLRKEFKVENGAFYYTDGREPLLLRKCEYYDGAEPSGNAVHCENLLRLFQITQETEYLTQAEDILKAAKVYMENYPPGSCYHLLALQRYLDKKMATIVIALDETHTLKKEIKEVLGAHFCLHAQVLWKDPRDQQIAILIPAVADKRPIDGQTAVYICRSGRCEAPLLGDDIPKHIQNLVSGSAKAPGFASREGG